MPSVLFVYHDNKFKSGASSSMTDVLVNLKKLGFNDFTVLYPKKSSCMSRSFCDLNILSNSQIYFSSRYTHYDGEVGKNIIERFKSTLKTIITFFSALLFIIKGNARGVDLIYVNTTDNYMGYFISKLTGKKLIWHVREFGMEDQQARHVFGDSFFYNIILPHASLTICISKVLEKHLKFKNNNIETILIYDDLLIENDLNYYAYDEKIKMLMVGTISEGKGQRTAIEIVKRAIKNGLNVEVGIVGSCENEYAKKIMRDVKINSLGENVIFYGYKGSDELNELRKHYPYSLVLSRMEAFGRITIEAMNCGQIVIATNTGANTEIITNCYTGFCYANIDEIVNDLPFIKELDNLTEIRYNAHIKSQDFTCGRSSKKILDIINAIQ